MNYSELYRSYSDERCWEQYISHRATRDAARRDYGDDELRLGNDDAMRVITPNEPHLMMVGGSTRIKPDQWARLSSAFCWSGPLAWSS